MVATDNILKKREIKDFEGQIVQRARRPDRLQAAVAAAYADILKSASAALKSGNSVLLYSGKELIDPITKAIQQEMGQKEGGVFYRITLKDSLDINPIWQDDGLVEHPTSVILRNGLQRFLKQHEAGQMIGVLGFIDALFSSQGQDQTDFLYLLTEYSGQLLLAFALPETPLPPVLLKRFPVQLSLPPLKRSQIWKYLSYNDVQNIFGATALSVGHQIALFHSVASLNVVGFRSLVDAMAEEGQPLSPPFDAIDRLKLRVAPWLQLASVSPPDGNEKAVEKLQAAVVEPFKHFYTSEITAEEVERLETDLPYGVILRGPSDAAERMASWLSAQLNSPYYSTSGARLKDIPVLFSRVHPYPIVIFVSDFEESLLADGEPLRALFASWHWTDSTRPVFVLAHLSPEATLPPLVQRRFTLNIDCK